MSGSSIRRVKHGESLRARVGQALSAAIISGELEPDTLLTVPTLAAQFDVSATPVREAMLDLESRGFVESVLNKGFRVTRVSAESLRQIVEVRQLLEPPAMAQLAGAIPEERLPALREQAERIVECARRGDLRGYLEADSEFHLGLTRLLGNPLLVDLIADLRSRTRLSGLARLQPEKLADSAAEHHGFLELLVAGDQAGVEAHTRHHIQHVLGRWQGDEGSV